MSKKGICLAILVAVLPAVVLASPGYSRGNAKSYADTYCRYYNPTYNCGFGADCQNFASQVLNAGGIPEVGWNKWDFTHWFFDHCSYFVNSWTANDWFNNHAAYWTSRYQNTDWSGVREADPVLFRWPDCSNWCHAGIYMGVDTAWEGSKAGQRCELRSQHTPERCRIWFWENVPSGTYLKVWHVVY